MENEKNIYESEDNQMEQRDIEVSCTIEPVLPELVQGDKHPVITWILVILSIIYFLFFKTDIMTDIIFKLL